MAYVGNVYELRELLVEDDSGTERRVSGRWMVIEHDTPDPDAGLPHEYFVLAPEDDDRAEACVTVDPEPLLEQIDPELVADERRREAELEAAEEAERLEERVREEEADEVGGELAEGEAGDG